LSAVFRSSTMTKSPSQLLVDHRKTLDAEDIALALPTRSWGPWSPRGHGFDGGACGRSPSWATRPRAYPCAPTTARPSD
jgi:hypothetical protein